MVITDLNGKKSHIVKLWKEITSRVYGNKSHNTSRGKERKRGKIMEIIDRVLDATEKKVFDLMFTKKEFEKWLAKNNLEFNTENLKKYKDYCFNWVLENVWEI